jgi:hypothetical protein
MQLENWLAFCSIAFIAAAITDGVMPTTQYQAARYFEGFYLRLLIGHSG